MSNEKYLAMIQNAQEKLTEHEKQCPVDLPVSAAEWGAWIRTHKTLSSKLSDARIAYARHIAMQKQGVSDDRRFR